MLLQFNVLQAPGRSTYGFFDEARKARKTQFFYDGCIQPRPQSSPHALK